MKRLISLSCLLCTVWIGVFGATYYVATSGDDANSGTISNPFQTLVKAESVVQAGDTIYMRGGTHAYSTRINLTADGTSSANISLLAYNGETVILDFSSMPTNTSYQGIMLQGDYWYIENLEIKGAGDNGMLIEPGSYNTIVNCKFYENRDTGLQLKGGAAFNTIINCDSYYNEDPTHENADGFAPKLSVGTGNKFVGCRAWQNADDGWDCYDAVAYVELENCWAFRNGYLKNGSASAGDGNGFKLGGNYAETDIKLVNCMVFNNRLKGFDQNHCMGNIELYNGIAYDNYRNYNIYESVGSGDNITITNCVSYQSQNSDALAADAILTTNSWQGFTVDNSDFQSLDYAQALADRQADGSLPVITFLHLATGSDLIDGGTDIGLPYNGSAPDLGANESDGTAATTYTLTVSVVGQGTISPNGGQFTENSNVTCEAIPSEGWLFDYWSGDLSGSTNPESIVMDADKSITAHFVLSPYFDLISPVGSSSKYLETFTWSASGNADSYTLIIDDNSDFSSPHLTKTGITSEAYTLVSGEELVSNTTYYWKVIAYAGSNPTECNAPFEFTTKRKLKSAMLSTAVTDNSVTDVKVYPNPATGLVIVTLNTSYTSSVILSNIAGHKVAEFIPEGDKVLIDTDNFDAGIYFISINNKSVKLIIK